MGAVRSCSWGRWLLAAFAVGAAPVGCAVDPGEDTGGTSATPEAFSVGGYYCPQSGSNIAGRGQPSDHAYYLTSFGGGSDTGPMACGGTADGTWLYLADSWRFGCGTHVRITNPATGASCVAQVADIGPNLCVEEAAGQPVIDASPLVAQHLFGASGAGWSDRLRVLAEATTDPLGCGTHSASPSPSPGGGGSAGAAGPSVGAVAAATSACDSSGVHGLSAQLVAVQRNCIDPGRFVSFAPHANVVLEDANVFPYAQASARDALWSAADRGALLHVTSAFRTLAQQYVLYASRACGLTAVPGASNHETGVAVDLADWSSVVSTMASVGCVHSYPSSDPVHFDCPGADLRADSVRAFQHLWNINHPEDRIAEDGEYGPMTEARLERAPANGFPTLGSCADSGDSGSSSSSSSSSPPIALPPTGCEHLEPGHGLVAGQQLASCDGRFTLAMQTDGNLVVYQGGHVALWNTGTNGRGGHLAVMQTDGNFVLYDAAGHALWSSRTNGHVGASLAMQNDGNLVVYPPGGGPALWDSHTCCH